MSRDKSARDEGRARGGGRSADATDETAPLVAKEDKKSGIPLVGAGVSTFWHEWQLCRIGRGVDPDPNMSWGVGLAQEALWWGIVKGGPVGWWKSYNGH